MPDSLANLPHPTQPGMHLLGSVRARSGGQNRPVSLAPLSAIERRTVANVAKLVRTLGNTPLAEHFDALAARLTGTAPAAPSPASDCHPLGVVHQFCAHGFPAGSCPLAAATR